MESPSRSGAFKEGVDRRLELFSESISFDHQLVRQDVQGSIAHAKMLCQRGILTTEEFEKISTSLKVIGEKIESGEIPHQTNLEDIHMHVEHQLIEELGDLGRKLHTGRSRNDQVSTDFRLWVREKIDQLDQRLADLQRAFVSRCDKDKDTILPAYTHLQRAQPVLANHYWMAYCEKFQRDRERLADCRNRVNQSPLGAAAVAGTSISIDREFTAKELGFQSIMANSIDVSSDRDFVLETAFCLTTVALHLSTLAEEWILWSTVEYDFLDLPHSFCTGSSIMPQKVNPDTMELIRGKTARVVGNLQQAVVLIKGLPLAYNRDLQEDKEALFDSVSTVDACLELAACVVEQANLKTESINSRLEDGYLDATSLMEFFIKRGMPQRQAHHAVGTLVKTAIEQGLRLEQLSMIEFQKLDPEVGPEVFEVLGSDGAVESFVSYGSTAPSEVQKQVESWKKRLSS